MVLAITIGGFTLSLSFSLLFSSSSLKEKTKQKIKKDII